MSPITRILSPFARIQSQGAGFKMARNSTHDSMATTRSKQSNAVALREQLPFWPNDQRGLPNCLARSALFTVANVRSGRREHLKRQLIKTMDGTTIHYTGSELRQDDEDCFMHILHVARMHTLGTEVRFTAHNMLVQLNWSPNSASYKRLVDCIDRLQATSISITVEDPTRGVRENYTGSLLRSFRWREMASEAPMREWVILLEPEIVALFSPTSYSQIEWKTRMSLGPMAKWLHSFYHTLETPIPMQVPVMRDLMGSKAKELRQFRYKLRQALEQLVEQGFLTDAQIDTTTDFVLVQRGPVRSLPAPAAQPALAS